MTKFESNSTPFVCTDEVRKPNYKKETKSFTMSTEDKIRRGQAYNLAVAAAIADGKSENKKEIFSKFCFYYDLGKLCQTYSLDEIRELLK